MPTTIAVAHIAVLLALTAQSGASGEQDCNKALTTMDINECASIEQAKVEKKLNSTYQRALKSLSGPGTDRAHSAKMKTSLVAAQRAWIKFREADCNAQYVKHAGGTIRTVVYIGCMQQHAAQRIKDLEDYVDE